MSGGTSLGRVSLGAVLCLAWLGGCSTTFPSPDATPSPTAAPTPHQAQVVIEAFGSVATPCPQGMRASVVIRPATDGASPQPVWTIQGEDRIELDLEPTACESGTVGPPPDNHLTLGVGRFDVAGVLEILDDSIDSASLPVPGQGKQVVPACVVPVDITTDTVRVHVTVDFDGALTAPCAISAETD